MSLGVCSSAAQLRPRLLPLRYVTEHKNATSALAGGCLENARRRSVLARTAQRDEVEEGDSGRSTRKGVVHDSRTVASSPQSTTSQIAEVPASPLTFANSNRLPNLACNPANPSCLSIRSIEDPCLDDSLDLKMYGYMEQMVLNGMTRERAAAVIRQWSSGGGVSAVDLRKLRAHFLATTLTSVAQQHMPPVLALVTLTWLTYWSLGQLPGADDAVISPGLRGALVTADLLMLMAAASNCLKRTGRLVRVGRAALEFSSRAELVLLALEDIARGHGNLILAVQAYGSPVAAAQRRASREAIRTACNMAMCHAKRQATATSAANTCTAPVGRSSAMDPNGSSTAAATPSSSSPPPLSSLDSFLVLQQAAVSGEYGRASASGGGGSALESADELGMTPTEAAAAAAMYARYGDSNRGGRMGDYELRRLMQEACAPALSDEELTLALLLWSRGRRTTLNFGDWAAWWAATATTEVEVEGR